MLAERYQVLRVIGRGGMGAVYEGSHLGLGKRVAIKVLLQKLAKNQEAIERFHREATNASRIGNDHVADINDIGYTPDGRTFVVMELLEGKTLGRLIQETAPMPAARVVHIIRQVLLGLGAAHDKGVVHRDVKPDNIFLVRAGEDPDYVKILDFGVSKITEGTEQQLRLTKTGMVVGTPVYMAPEQAMGATVDFRADLYSVGVMFYEMLAGRPPFYAPNYVALMTQHIQNPPPDLGRFRPDLGPALASIVHRTLNKDPRQRWAHASEMIAALPGASQLAALDSATTLGPGRRSGGGPAAATPTPSAAAQVLPMLPGRAGGPPAQAMLGQVSGASGSGPAVTATRPRQGRPGRGSMIAWVALGTLAVGGIAVAVLGRGAPPASTPMVPLGTLDIITSPPGATVFVDDIARGVTPIVVEAAVGTHRIRIEKDGHVGVSTDKVVEASGPTTMVLTLPPLEVPAWAGQVDARTAPIDAGALAPPPPPPPGQAPARPRPAPHPDRPGSAAGSASAGSAAAGSAGAASSGPPGDSKPDPYGNDSTTP